ncbi:MAG TPA: DUF5723 family protein [Draconibacterium sp.]|nr:DUF5723 family protein [Draconibacterium sp.]
MKRATIILLLFAAYFSEAQNTMYFMDRLPQNIAYNPAIMPKMDFFIGLPGIGGVNTQAYNSGFNYNEINDFFDNLNNPNYNPDDFVKSIGDYNLFTGEASVNMASFGFKIKEKAYLSFLVTMNSLFINKASSEIAYILADLDNLYPEDFPIIVDDFSAKGNAYLNFGVTYSRMINEHLTLGITPRINFNQAGLKTNNLYFRVDYNEPEIDVSKDEYEETYRGDIEIGLPTEINPEAIEDGELVGDADLLPENWEEDITLGRILKDKSFMVDIGATYNLEKWTFSASLLNLGNSVFKTDGYMLNGNGDKVFVNEVYKIKIGIPTKLYIGAMRQFLPKWNYALLFNNNFYSTGSVATATASLNGYIGSALSASISYTAGYKYDNLGIGFRLRFLPGTDLYFVTDNIIQAFNYRNAYRFTAAAGINISIGIKEKLYDPIVVPANSN